MSELPRSPDDRRSSPATPLPSDSRREGRFPSRARFWLVGLALGAASAAVLAATWGPTRDAALEEISRLLGERRGLEVSIGGLRPSVDGGVEARGVRVATPGDGWSAELERAVVSGQLLEGVDGIRELEIDGLRVLVDLESPEAIASLRRWLARLDSGTRAPLGEERADPGQGRPARTLRVRDATVRFFDGQGPLVDVDVETGTLETTGELAARLSTVTLASEDPAGWTLRDVDLRRGAGPTPATVVVAELQGSADRAGTAELAGRFSRLAALLQDRAEPAPPGPEAGNDSVRSDAGREEETEVRGRSLPGSEERGEGEVVLARLAGLLGQLEPGRAVEVRYLEVLDPERRMRWTSTSPLTVEVLGLRDGRPSMGLRGAVLGRAESAGEAPADELPLRIRGELVVAVEPSGAGVVVEGTANAAGLSLERSWIHSRPVRVPEVELALRRAEIRPSLAVEGLDAVLTAAGVESRLQGSASLVAGSSVPRLDLEWTVPETSCARLLAAVPEELLGVLGTSELDGTMAVRVVVDLDPSELDRTDLDIGIEDRCRFVEVPDLARIERLREPFLYRVPDPDDPQTLLVRGSGPGSGAWVPLEDVSPFLVATTLGHEDAGFWKHRGFAVHAIESALVDNLRAGEVVRGGSTVSMQLAKNLFLRPERTVARKVREAFLTWWLERNLSKDEILELYFNVVEYGPGVYGIAEASRHYFGVTPDRLGPAQAAFLAEVLPSPRTTGRLLETGGLDERTRSSMRFLLRHVHRKGLIDDRALGIGLVGIDEFRFGPAARPLWVRAS